MYTLDDLFAKEIYNDDIVEENGNYKTALFSYEEIVSKLRALLPEENSEIVEQLSVCMKEIEFQRGKAMFSAGFSLGKKYAEEISLKNKWI